MRCIIREGLNGGSVIMAYIRMTYIFRKYGHSKWLTARKSTVTKPLHYANRTTEKKKVTQSIRTDGDRVYCLDNLESRNWLLGYDFSLKVNQTCDLYLLNDDYYPHTYEYSVKCTGIHESVDNPGFEIMEMSNTERQECENSWIKGIGSYSGPCDYFLAGMIGCGSKLIWVYDNGKLVYLAPEDIFF